MIPMLCFVAVLVIEYMGFRKRTKEYRELEHFAEFLSDLKNQFYLCKSVTESIFLAAEKVPGSLRKRLEEICFLLEEDMEEAGNMEERFPAHLKHLRLFWIQCRSAVQYGSGKDGAESVFVKNMTELRRDVQNECYQRAQAMYLFAGMGVVVAAPVVFLPFIRWFGAVTLEELQAFYEGQAGKMVVAMFGLLTAGCYFLLGLVRRTDKRIYRRSDVLKRVFSGNGYFPKKGFLKGSPMERFGAEKMSRAGIEANGMQYWATCGIGGVATALIVVFLLRQGTGKERCIAILCGAGIGIMMVAGFYKYLSYLRKLGMESEVLNLQAVVLLLIDVPNITLMEVLDVLGACGELFRKRLYRCADEYVAEDVMALERMFSEDTTPGFHQLAGRLLASERIGIRAAFEEISGDRHFFREQLRMDSEQEQKKKAANAQVIVFFPMMFLLFAYLIFPFLSASLEQMGDIFREMEQIRYF